MTPVLMSPFIPRREIMSFNTSSIPPVDVKPKMTAPGAEAVVASAGVVIWSLEMTVAGAEMVV